MVQQHLQVHSKIVSKIQASFKRLTWRDTALTAYFTRASFNNIWWRGTRASVLPPLCRLAQACRGVSDTLPASVQENLRGGDPLHRWIRTTDEWQAYDKYCRSKGWRGASVPSMCGFLKNQVLAILRLNFEVEGSREMVQKHGLLWLSENGYIGQDCIRLILSVADGLVEAGAVQ